MTKEIYICIIIVISVICAHFACTNYTKNSTFELENIFNEFKLELEKDDSNDEEINSKMKFIKEKWQDKYEKLAFYIEHDELEKVETEIYGINANIDTGNYDEAIEKVEKCKFILKHIGNKESLSFKNIF